MAEVGVHVHGDIKSVPPPQFEAFQDRCSETASAASHQHMQPGVALRVIEGNLSGAVWGIVVDDQQLEFRRYRQHSLDQRRDVLALVVGGRHDEDTARGPIAP